ncbi:hypothetical protein C3F09_10685 [candidate division GN15 bacterium]|uniref:Uncharacterized protein n=1 Tax=candidate division GN15 bacterium TaxID=2072418 RepID=A0A855WW95_9BACT|nr:MAG: hypothetical protein C3F09_10685 [candidate division GN15 bacterium]
MISGIDRLTARRIWFVPDFMVWGLPNVGQIECIASESVDGATNVMFGLVDIGDGPQQVLFSELLDHRGNNLPASINAPRVFPRARTADATFVVETESPTGFRIARDSSGIAAVPVDLLVVEMGN